MNQTVNHRDGSRTVYFSGGNKVRFDSPRHAKAAPKNITGTPYIFAAGPKIDLPEGVAHGMLFEHRRKTYVALHYRGKDALGRKSSACYGQPVTLTRPL